MRALSSLFSFLFFIFAIFIFPLARLSRKTSAQFCLYNTVVLRRILSMPSISSFFFRFPFLFAFLHFVCPYIRSLGSPMLPNLYILIIKESVINFNALTQSRSETGTVVTFGHEKISVIKFGIIKQVSSCITRIYLFCNV